MRPLNSEPVSGSKRRTLLEVTRVKHRSAVVWKYMVTALVVLSWAGAGILNGQDRLKSMPGYEHYVKMSGEIPGSVRLGVVRSVKWRDGGKAVEYRKDNKTWRYEIASTTLAEIPASSTEADSQAGRSGSRFRAGGPARGRQFESAVSPDGKHKAFYRDRNLWLSDADGSNELAVTSGGNERARIKFGTASWVYGEELSQRSAMWWSPDSRKIAFYRFDESKVPDYYLQLDQTKLQSRMDVEPYPKAGVTNPIVDLLVYDLSSGRTVTLDVRDGRSFDDSVVGHYVYQVSWSADGTELLFNRTNRRQNIMEFAACSPETGKCRAIVREEWPESWTENSPTVEFLKDGRRFVWASQRTGWRNYYLYDLSGRLLAQLTSHSFEVGNIVQVNEAAGVLFYMARSGDNHMKLQLHRVGLDGKNDLRLTDPTMNHTVDVAPDGLHFIDTAQTHDVPPTTRLMDAEGKVVADLASSDTTRFEQLGLGRVEMFTFKSADGKTDLQGMLHRPADFDAGRKYPLLVTTYAGPETNGARETFTLPNAITELGFLVASLDARSAAGRGKKFLDAIYLHLGVAEIDDLAAGVKYLKQRPYVDGERIGIYGTSYGGYASLMCILRYPDLFQAACASSPVTDYRNYDSIYTERYLWLPQENKEGYDAGSAMTYADKLKGRLMLYYGTADNNVHPSNTLQLITALQRAGKSFEVQVGPDQGHSSIRLDRMLEFFMESFMLRSVPAVP
jgi:dipeptidyl-peptidase-4